MSETCCYVVAAFNPEIRAWMGVSRRADILLKRSGGPPVLGDVDKKLLTTSAVKLKSSTAGRTNTFCYSDDFASPRGHTTAIL